MLTIMEQAKEIAAKKNYDIGDLRTIMAILRSDNGCPWDREQTHESIRNNFIEETYEVIEAIDTDDGALLREELGDVLLQVVFHARIAEEEGAFSFDGVVNDICVKLVERHPHIFGDVKADTSAEVLVNWDKIKREKKQQTTVAETLSSVSKAMPSLMRAGKLAKKAAKAGMPVSAQPESLTEEKAGELLFALAAASEFNGINAEEALYNECERFIAQISEFESK